MCENLFDCTDAINNISFRFNIVTYTNTGMVEIRRQIFREMFNLNVYI